MELSEKELAFIKAHGQDDVTRLLLDAGKYAGLDIPFLAEQIAARRQVKDKLPAWGANDAIVYPAKIAAEQCSSEQTAQYKADLITTDDRVCDLTGGLGVDSYYLSRKAKSLIYVERFPYYCDVARHNFQVLGCKNIEVVNEDSRCYLEHSSGVDVYYIDPARRGEGNRRVYALEDCEPNLVEILPLLLQKALKVLAKISPMADISKTLSLLPGTVEVHVVSVRNECKELLFAIRKDGVENNPLIRCVNYDSQGNRQVFDCSFEEEQQAPLRLADSVKRYLYEPNASIMKAGAFKCIAERFGVKKLQVNSHLYVADTYVSDFPGRGFQIEEVLHFSGKLCKTLAKDWPQANIAIRNFPLTAEELRKRTRIKDGGDIYLFGTTLWNGDKVLLITRKA